MRVSATSHVLYTNSCMLVSLSMIGNLTYWLLISTSSTSSSFEIRRDRM